MTKVLETILKIRICKKATRLLLLFEVYDNLQIRFLSYFSAGTILEFTFYSQSVTHLSSIKSISSNLKLKKKKNLDSP